ncbi:D-alanyl-D-alanine carboxypeptidase family protein, partial [Streptomyces hainanensis]
APPKPAAPPPPPADADRDPLELLASLTNRPAPPETPLRMTWRRVKIYTPFALLLLVALVVAQSLRPLPEPELRLTASETYTFDGEAPSVPWPASGQSALDVEGLGGFGTSGEQEPVPIASVAKVMTAYVILREHPMEFGSTGAAIPVDQQAEDDAQLSDDGESTVEVEAGTDLTQHEALQAIMIASANNVARLLARWDAGSEEAFVDKMNETAAELGMENTTYTDPSGLNSDTVSTAEDQVLLGRAAMEDPVFRDIVAQLSYDDSQGENHSNWNQLVSPGDVVGIKTGTTTAAGGNLLFAAVQDVDGAQQMIIGAVLAQPPHPSDNSILTGALTAGGELIDFAQGTLRGETLIAAGEEVGYVDDGLGGRTPVVVTEDVQAAGWDGLEVRMDLEPGGDGVPATATAGTEVGTLTIGSTSVPIALGSELAEPGFTSRLLRLG